MNSPRIRRAIISVSDKLGLAGFARGLSEAGVEIYSTGGTRRHLESEGCTVHDIAAYTGFPEMMDGRVKTLHPKVFAGILCRRERADDMQALAAHGIASFELVVVNLYPFEATVAKAGVTDEEAIEQIDIGGPSLVRAAAKNHAEVTIATNAAQYSSILQQIQESGCTSFELRRRLAGEAFAHTAAYDRAIAAYFAREAEQGLFPEVLTLSLHRKELLRYGENPHQQAALYCEAPVQGAHLVSGRQLHGKELSYNNLLDLDSALAIASSLQGAAAAVIKHNNPCGAAFASTLREAIQKAMEGDPVSAFGSVLGFNQDVDAATAEYLATPGLFVEAIVAPRFTDQAVKVLTTQPKWKNNVRLLEVGQLEEPRPARHYRYIQGGMLVQDADNLAEVDREWQVVTEVSPDDNLWAQLRFAWSIVRHVKSNAIVLCRDNALCGVGAGQMSRVDSVEIAIRKAGPRAAGAVLASDAFFPFPDSIEHAADAGVAAVIQPGGSKKDEEVIAACNRHRIPMVFTGRRHFKH
jgi:phosphoribosylaminoimidazolecarboxamide formyltransferase/IMP cyclohydrolase